MSKNPVYVTPKGTLLYPHLTKPDIKFVPEGLYGTKIVLPPSPDRDELMKTIATAMDEAYTTAAEENPKKQIKKADPPFVDEVDKDGDPTGNIVLHAKMKAFVKPKNGSDPFSQVPSVFDGLNKRIDIRTIQPWTGTVARISFEIVPFYVALVGAGAALRLKAVQILELVEGGGRSAEEYGFEPDEDGWNSATTPPSSEVSPENEDDLPF